MPALRIGFVISPFEFCDDVAYFKSIADISTSLFIQFSFSYFLQNYFDVYVKKISDFISKKQIVIDKLLEKHNLKSLLFCGSIDGIYVSLILPQNITSPYFYNRLKSDGILVLPHSCFYHKPLSNNFVRLCFLNCTDEQLNLGIEAIRKIVLESK